MPNDGVGLRSASHPRSPWWRRLFPRHWRLRFSSLVNEELEAAQYHTHLTPGGLKIESKEEPLGLVAKLRYVGALKIGEDFPPWLGGNSGWGLPLAKLLNEAADEIERLSLFEEFYYLTKKNP